MASHFHGLDFELGLRRHQSLDGFGTAVFRPKVKNRRGSGGTDNHAKEDTTRQALPPLLPLKAAVAAAIDSSVRKEVSTPICRKSCRGTTAAQRRLHRLRLGEGAAGQGVTTIMTFGFDSLGVI